MAQMQHRLGMAIVCLHISAVVYGLVGVVMMVLMFVVTPEERAVFVAVGLVTAVLCAGLIVGIEVVAWGLKRRKFWAWVAGLCIFGLYVPSLFLPLGALGLWGLLDRGSREAVGVRVRPAGA